MTYHNNMVENKDARSIKVLPNDNFIVGVLCKDRHEDGMYHSM